MPANFEFRPTLLVGLGGTGTTILTSIKALLLDNVGENIFNTIRLMAVDTDDRLPEVRRRNGEVVKLSQYTEYVNIGYVPVANIMQHLKGYPEIAAWMPPDLPLPAIAQGARMVRLLGRLSLFYHFRKVADAFRPQVRRLRHLALPESAVISEEGDTIGERARTPGINVFIIASMCGGTGAGTFLDMAYLIRQFCRDIGLPQEYIYVNGVLVLPSAFPTVRAQGRIAANTKSCLDDLDQLMKGGYTENYPDNVRIAFPYTQPFNVCYLVDAINRDGQTLNGLDELASLLATSIYLQVASQVGPATKSRWDNIDSLSNHYEGKLTAYSGLGCAKLVFPARRMIEICAQRFCQAFIERKLLRPAATDNTLDQLWLSFASEQKISREAILNELLNSNNRQQPRITTGINSAALADVGADQVIERVRRLVTTAENRLEDQQAKQMQGNQEKLGERLLLALNAQIEQLVNDPAHGLNTVLAFVAYMEEALANLSTTLNEAREDLSLKQNSERQRCNETFAVLSAAVNNRLPIWGNRQVTTASTEYSRNEDQRLRNRLALMQYDQALGLLSFLRSKAGELRRSYTNLRDQLATIAHDLINSKDQQLDPEQEIERLTWPVVGQRDLENYYQRFLPGEEQWLTLAAQHSGSLAQWLSLSPQEFKTTLLTFARQPFAPIEKINIEECIADNNNGDMIGRWLERIRNRAVPLWSWMKGQGSKRDDPEEIRVLGVYDQASSVFNAFFTGSQQRGEEIISMNDPHTIAMLRTEHGMPTTALNQYDDYARSYDEYARGNEQAIPLRLFDPATRAKVTDDSAQIKLAFAKGEVFGQIAQDNEAFWFRRYEDSPDQGWRPERRLSRDLEDAILKLAQLPDHVKEIDETVERHRAEIGNRGIVAMVEKHLETPANEAADPLETKLRQELKTLLKQWAAVKK